MPPNCHISLEYCTQKMIKNSIGKPFKSTFITQEDTLYKAAYIQAFKSALVLMDRSAQIQVGTTIYTYICCTENRTQKFGFLSVFWIRFKAKNAADCRHKNKANTVKKLRIKET